MKMKTIGKVFVWLIAIVLALEVVSLAVGYFSRWIPKNTVLAIRLEGSISEEAPQDALSELAFGQRTTVADIVEALDRARTDPRIRGLVVRVGEPLMGLAKMQQVRRKIREFNRSGKFSVAYLEFGTNRSYYLASACQTVILMPRSVLYLRGLMTSTTFYRGTLDKLGVYPDLYHIGEYKNAMNVYTEKKYSPPHREADLALLEDFQRQFIRGLGETRGMPPEEMEQAIARGPFSSEEALAAKLVDRLGYDDESRKLVEEKNKGSDSRLSLHEYLRRTERKGRSKLAVIYATGTILPGHSSESPWGGPVMGSETIAEQFRSVRDDESVRAVVLRIDSPGGAAFASEVIRREVERTHAKKPVVVSMSDVAASGGYWIAMGADKVLAEPGTITGSIGVLAGKFNLTGLYQKLGLSKDHLETTPNSTMDWPFQNFTPAQRESLLRLMNDTYKDFVQGVAKGRKMEPAAVEKVAQGRVWTGEQARERGLVDGLGGFDAAIDAAKQLAKIPKEEQVTLIYLPKPRPLLNRILDLIGSASFVGGRASPGRWLQSLESLARTPVWALLPAVPEVE
jgi:protease-4